MSSPTISRVTTLSHGITSPTLTTDFSKTVSVRQVTSVYSPTVSRETTLSHGITFPSLTTDFSETVSVPQGTSVSSPRVSRDTKLSHGITSPTFTTQFSETVAVHQVTSVYSPLNFRNSTGVGSPIAFTVKVTSIETTSVAATTEPISNATNENLEVTMEIVVPVNEDVSSPSFKKKIEVGIANSYVRALEKQATLRKKRNVKDIKTGLPSNWSWLKKKQLMNGALRRAKRATVSYFAEVSR